MLVSAPALPPDSECNVTESSREPAVPRPTEVRAAWISALAGGLTAALVSGVIAFVAGNAQANSDFFRAERATAYANFLDAESRWFRSLLEVYAIRSWPQRRVVVLQEASNPDDSDLGPRGYYSVPIQFDNARRDLAIKNTLTEADDNLAQLNQAIAQLTFVATPEVYDRAAGVLASPGYYFSMFVSSGPEGVQKVLERRAGFIKDFIAATRADIGLDGRVRSELFLYNEEYILGSPEYWPDVQKILEVDSEREIELDEADLVRQVDQRRLEVTRPR